MQSIYLRLRLATTYESPILGAGAVGGLVGAVLAHEGEDLTLLPATMRNSMQKDVSAGRMPELDALGDPILRRGERYNLNIPVTREVVARIQDRLSTLHSASAS